MSGGPFIELEEFIIMVIDSVLQMPMKRNQGGSVCHDLDARRLPNLSRVLRPNARKGSLTGLK